MAERSGQSPLESLRQQLRALGLTLRFAGATGAGLGQLLLADAQGGLYSAAVLGPIDVDLSGQQAQGTRWLGNGGIGLTQQQHSLALSPSLGDLPALAAFVRGLGGSTTLQADGSLLLQLQEQQYAVQPGYALNPAHSAHPAQPGLGQDGAGYLSWADAQGRQQTLYPAAADFDRLRLVAEQLLPGAQVRGNANGSISVQWGGQQMLLLPDYALIATPLQYIQQAWWIGSDGKFYLRYPGKGRAQGFSLR
ncbi:hypothetical protein MASR1M59_29210 [Melaminivora sp.]